MNDEQQMQQPETPDPDFSQIGKKPGDLCDEALVFIWDVSKVVEAEIRRLSANSSADEIAAVQNRVSRIMKDIRRQIKDCPKGAITGDVPCCTTCLPSYNTCIRNGGNPATCMNNYTNCTNICDPRC